MTKEVIELIENNKDLPIYAYVATEVVGDDMSSYYWLGKVKSARIGSIAFVEPFGYDERTFVEKSDLEEYEEYLIDSLPSNFNNDLIDIYIKDEINKLEFKDVILLHIDTV